jgi:hypothetical protein
MLDRGTFTLPRLNAHRVVLAAAALTTLVAAALATTLVVLSGQALPRAVHQRLTAASGPAMIVAGPITNTDAAGYSAALRTDMTAALASARPGGPGRAGGRAGRAHRGRGGRGNATAPPS